MSARRRSRRLLTTSAFGALALAALWAAPARAQLVQTGAASNGTAPVVDQSVPNTTTVTLGGSRTVIDWSRFDINSADTANFVFANRSDIVLNRVNSATSSTINGNLNGTIGSTGGPAGGNIWIYNANGVVIGANARITTGGLLVTTAAVNRAEDASSGGFLDAASASFGFTGAANGAGISVLNGAQVTSHGGAIALVAPVVTTEAGSSISAQDGGNVLVGSAAKYQISFSPTGTDDFDLLSFEVANGSDGAGKSSGDSIDLAGSIDGNRVFVAAVSKSGLAATILSSGTITATSAATDETGAIVLSANHNIVGGAVDASAVSDTGTGFAGTFGGELNAPAISIAATEGMILRGDVTAAGGTVDLQADNGDIRQTQGVITADTLTARAHSGINFNSFSANRVDKLGALSTDTGDLAYIGDEDSVELTGLISAPGKVTLGARGFIDASTGSITAGSLELFLGGGGSFKVNGDANLGSGLSNGAVTIEASGNITLANEFYLTLGDQLTLTAGDAISETTGFVTGGGAIVANAVNGIDLGQANQVARIAAVSSGGGALNLRSTGNLDLGGSRTSGTFSATADTGNITASNFVTAGVLSATASAGSIEIIGGNPIFALGAMRAGGDIAIGSGQALSLTGDISGVGITLNSFGGGITQGPGTTITAATLSGFAMGDVTLDQANAIGTLAGFRTELFDSGHDITIRNSGDLVLGGLVAAGAGKILLTSDTGAISQDSTSTLTAISLSADAAGSITLDRSANQIIELRGLRSSGGDVTVAQTAALEILDDIDAAGTVSLSSGGAIDTYGGHLSADLLNVSTGGEASFDVTGNLKLGAINIAGGGFYLGSDADIQLTDAVNVSGGNLTLYTSGGAITRNGGTISVPYNGVSGVTYATAQGGIDLSSVGDAVIWATSNSGGDITLSGDGDVGFAVNTTGDLTVTAGGWAGNNADVIARSVGISAGTGISLYDQTVNIDIGSYRYLTVGDGYIDIENQRDINLDGDVTANGSSGWVRLNSSQNSLLQNSGTISAYGVEIDAAQSILQDVDARVVTGDGGLTFRGTDVTLAGANAFPWINAYSVSHDLTLRTADTLNLNWTQNQAGSAHNFTLISDNGDIRIGYGVINVDLLNATALNGSITIQNGNQINSIRALGDLTAKSTSGTDIYIYTNTALDLTGTISGGGVALYAQGALTESTGTIQADRLAIGVGAGIQLGGANNFGTLTDIGHANGAAVTIRNLGNILLPSTLQSFGTLTLTSDTGSISQTTGITVNTLVANAATGIGFNSSSNNFTTLAGLATTAGDIRIRDTGGLAIEGNIAAPGAVLLSTTGAITTGTTTVGVVTTPHGKVDADSLSVVATNATIYAAGDIKLDGVGINSGFTLVADNNIDLTGDLSAVAASLLASAGSITQSGGILNGRVAAAANGSITLDKANNLSDFTGTSYNGGSITFNNAASGAMTLSLNTTGDAVITAAGNLQGFGIAANDLSVTAGHIDLTNSIAVSSFSKLIASYGDVLVTNSGSFTVSGDVSASKIGLRSVNLYATGGGISQTGGTISANDVTLRGSGDITQSGTGRVDANVTYLTGANLDLRGDNSFGSATPSVIRAGGNVLLNGDALNLQFFDPATDVTLTATGDITIGNMGLTANTLTADAGGALSAASGNQIGTVHGLSGSSIVFANGTGFTLDGDVTATTSAALTATSGDIAQTAGTISAASATMGALAGSITQSGTAKILATSLTASSGGDLILGGVNSFASAGSSFAYGDGTNPADVTIRNLGSIDFTAAPGQAIGALSLTSDTGAITQTGAVTAGIFDARAATGITFDQTNAINIVALLVNSTSGGISFKSSGTHYSITGDVTAAGQTVTLASSNGQIIQSNGRVNAGLLNILSDGFAGLQGGTINAIGTVTSNHYVSIGGVTGDVALTGDIAAAGFGLTTSGDITQTGGAITTPDLSLSAGGDIAALGDNHVDQVRLMSSGTGAIRFNTLGDLKIAYGTSNADGLLDVRAGGRITVDQYSMVTASQLALHAGDDIAIDPLAELHIGTVQGLVSDTGDIDFYNYGGFVLDGDVSAAGTVSVRTGAGNITQQSGIIAAARLNIRTDLGNITLANANAVDQLGDVYAGNGDFSFTNAGDLALDGGVQAPGMVTLTSGGTISETVDGWIIGGGLTAHAETGISLGRNLFGTVWGLSSTSGGIVFSNNGAFDIQGDIDAGAADVSLTANGGGITGQSAGTITARTLTLDTEGDTDLTQVNHIESLGAIDTGTGYFHFGNAGDIVVGAWATGGDIALTSGGAISQTAGISATRFTASAVNGITLDNANNAIAAIGGLSNAGSGGATLVTHGNLDLDGDVTAAGQLVWLVSAIGAINQIGGGITADTLRASAFHGLSLTSTTNNVAHIIGLTSAASGGIAYTDADGFDIVGDINALNGQTLSLRVVDAGGTVQQGDAFVTAGTLNLSGGQGFTLLGQSSSGIGNHITAIGDVDTAAQIYSRDSLILTGTITSPNLALRTDGSITQNAAISVGALSATAIGGDIVLDQNNLIGTVNDITANGSVTLSTSGDMLLEGVISAPTLVKLTAGSDITQIAATGVIRSGRLEATSSAGAANGISLLGHNQVDQVQLDSNGNDLRLRNTSDFALGNIIAANHIVEMISDTGSVTQLAGTSITAGTFSATGTHVDLSNSGNQISRIGLISTGSDLAINNAVNLTIDAIDAGNHNVTINNGGTISGGNITGDALSVNGVGLIALSTASHIHSIAGLSGDQLEFVNDGSFTIATALQNAISQTYLTSLNGAISMAAGGAVNSGGVTAQAATGISLSGNMGRIYGATTSSGDVTLVSNLLDIDGDVRGDAVTLTATGIGGFVGQTSGAITANLLSASGDAYVDLSGAANHIAALGTLRSTSGDVQLASLDAVDLTGNIDASGTFLLTAGGAVRQSGGRIASTWLNVAGTGDVTLGAANLIDSGGDVRLTGSNVTFANSGSFTIAAIDAGSTGAIDLTSTNGDIWQSGAMNGGTISASAAGALSFNQANAIATLGTLSAGSALTYNSATNYTLTGDITAGTGVTLNGAGSVQQTAGAIAADTLNIDADSADLSLMSNTVAKLGTIRTNGDFLFRNVGDVEIRDNISADALSLYSNAGDIAQLGGTVQADRLNLIAGGSVDLDNFTANYLGFVTANTGNVTLSTSSNILGGLVIAAPNGTVDLSAGSITLDTVNADLLNVASSGDVEMLGDNAIAHLGYVSGVNVSLAVGNTEITGAIEASNSIAFIRAASAADFALRTTPTALVQTRMLSISNTGSAGTVTLNNINTPSGALELNLNFNGNASVSAFGSLVSLNNLIVDGDLLVRGSGIDTTGAPADISGTLSATALAGDINLLFGTDRIGHFGAITVAGPGTATLSAANVDLTGTVTALGGFRADATAGSVTQSAGSVISAASVAGSATGGDLLLGGSNLVGTIGDLTATGDLAFKTVGALDIASALAAGNGSTMRLIAGGNISASGGAALSGGTLSVTANGNVDLSGVNSNFGTLGDVSAAGFALHNTSYLALQGIQTVSGTLSLTVDSALHQGGGYIVADTLNLATTGSVWMTEHNRVNTLGVSAIPYGGLVFSNDQDLTLSGPLDVASTVMFFVNGHFTAASGVRTIAGLAITADGIDAGNLDADGALDLNGGAGDVNLGQLTAGGPIRVLGTGAVTIGAIDMLGDAGAGNGFEVHVTGSDITLGGANGGTGANYLRYANGITPGAVAIEATGDVRLGLDNMNATIDIAAAGDVNAISNGQLLLGTVSGANVSLTAGADLQMASVTVPGTYAIHAQDFSAGAFNILGGNPLDILVTDTLGDLTLGGTLVANRHLTISAVGDVLGGTARLGAGAGMEGALDVTGTNIDLLEASSLYDVRLNGTGTVNIGDLAYVGRDYVLSGSGFAGAALAPIGARSGSWSLTSFGDLDLGAATLEYGGDIALSVHGLLRNGSVRSLAGTITGTVDSADVNELLGGSGVNLSSTVGAFDVFHVDGGIGDARISGFTSIGLGGSIEAGGNVALSTSGGGILAGYASAGGDLTLYAQGGDAVLRQATLTGTSGNLSIRSMTGAAVLGADDYGSIGSDNHFTRAAGSTGSAHVSGDAGAQVNLDRSADLTLVSGASAEVNVLNGDLNLDTILATSGTATAYLDNGALRVNTASGDSVDLQALGGNLTLGSGGITANALYLSSDGVIDTTATALSLGNYLYANGGTVRAGALHSDGDVELYAGGGGVTAGALTAVGDATVAADGDIGIDQIAIHGGQFLSTAGSITVRGISASDGFALGAQGNISLGADAGQAAGAANGVVTGGSLAGCGCGSGGGSLISLGGDVTVNLFGMTGIFDLVAADSGNVDVRLAQGDLGIHTLAGHDIAVVTPGVLTVIDAQSSGGSYTLTAADFGTFTLSPTLFGGATRLGDVTIVDTRGDLHSFGALSSSGNIRVKAQDGAITGGLVLQAAGDVTAIGQGVALQRVEGRDVTIDAGTGTAAISNTLSVGRDYTLRAGAFADNVLAASGARAGSLRITDTLGDFDFGTTDFAFGGAVSIVAANGLIAVGNLQAGSAIDLAAGGALSLASARLTGAGANALSLSAGGDLVFGAASPAVAAAGNLFANAGTALIGTGIQAGGDIAINLYQADTLGAIAGNSVQLAVRVGDFAAGNIDAAGAIAVQGPVGTLTLGNLTSSTGPIEVIGQGTSRLGDVTGPLAVNLSASAGNLSLGTVSGGDVTLGAGGGIDAAAVSAATLGVVAVGGGANLDNGGNGSQVGSLTGVTIGAGDFTLRNLQDLSLDGVIEVGGTVDLQVAGALTQNAYYIVADRLQGSVSGWATLAGANRIDTLGAFSSNGLRLDNQTALAINGLVQGNGGGVSISSHGGMTITANGGVASAGPGDAILLASDGRFINLAGAGALSAPNGRWLLYTQTAGDFGQSDPNNDFGGLAGTSYYGDAFDFGTGSFAGAPNAGDRFVYGYRPLLTVTPDSGHIVYNGSTPDLTATITGLVNGDNAAGAWSGVAELSGVGRNAGSYSINAALGSLASEMNYAFAFGVGTVVVDPRVITAILSANDRTYDGTAAASGSLGLNGVVAGDNVTASASSIAFDSRNAGARTATASGITLSGGDAANYTVNASATDLATILARAITATLVADSRTYDGTTAATGTLSLNGVIAGDTVGVGSAGIAFDSRNAGTRTATASSIALSGADAANYSVNASATALADILARAITATLTANDRTYDGTTTATGALALSGVLGNDQVTASGSLAFDNRNAGAGHIVTASEITLGGADAGNYVVNGSATALADIVARAITATLSVNDRSYDGTAAATGTLSLNGVVAGDAVAAGAGSIAFDSRNAGSRTATASGITLSGADAANYTVNASATGLATILARAITATLAANGRVYDGTTAATGTLSLSGVIAGDTVGVATTGIAFDSRNAGTRTATASGITLNGADAANYTVAGIASGTATISPRGITATASADSRSYDGTTAATGHIALTGVIAGDTVTGTASYRFADANADTGKAVQVSGLALSGADAANYTAALAATPVTADILRRAVTVTINDASKMSGQPDPAFSYRVTSGSVVSGEGFTGAPAREAGDLAGRYAIGQGSLALSANYLLTVVPGTLVISFTQTGAAASDAIKTLQVGFAASFAPSQDPSRNLEGDGGDDDNGDDDQ